MTTTAWREHGACAKTADPRIFWPPSATSRDAVTAATYCRNCPVLATCVRDARSYSRLTGVVQAGSYWTDGHPSTIPHVAPPLGPSRSESNAVRRREAVARYYEVRRECPHDTAAYRVVAAEYGIAVSTVQNWRAAARKEASAKLAANRKAADAA
jgi:Transcription factor WhiB